jgi:hypothetical protein
VNPVNEHGDMIAISQYYRLASDFVAKLQTAAQENEALRNEVDEQARLNGKGSEREAALLAKVERLERENARLMPIVEAAKAYVDYEIEGESTHWPEAPQKFENLKAAVEARKEQPCQS